MFGLWEGSHLAIETAFEHVEQSMRKVNKSAVTGRFVSDKKVEENPKTTYEQTVKKPTGNKQTGKVHRQTPKK